MTIAVARWGFDESAQRRELHGERPWVVLLVGRNHPPAAQREEQFFDGSAHDADAADALVAAPRDDEDLFAAAHLMFTKPLIGSSNRHCRGRKMLAQVQRALRAEAQFVERAHAMLRRRV